MGKSEINLIALEVEVKRLADKIRDQQNLFDKRDCAYKEEITRLKIVARGKQNKEEVQGKGRSMSKVSR